MSEHTPEHDVTPLHEPAGHAGPGGDDTDGDPDTLNPREGAEASGGVDPTGDPDADPDMLNPRTGDAATCGDEL